MADGARYTKLAKTAQNFVLATSPKSPGTNQTDPERFLACLAPGFRISWGHKHFVSTKPPMQGALDGEGFCQHQAGMATNLQTWRIEPTSTCVDVDKQTAVVRADFFMTAPQQEAVLNDILFWIEMDAGGEKVKSAIEFIDPVATAELMERMQAGKASPRLYQLELQASASRQADELATSECDDHLPDVLTTHALCKSDNIANMRRNVLQTASRAYRSEISAASTRPTPFICLDCRRIALRTSQTPVQTPFRAFTTSPASHQQSQPQNPQQPQHSSPTIPQTHYDLFPSTFPAGPPPQSPFTPDLRNLKKEYLQLQAKAHPDHAPDGQHRQAEALSARINEAYKTISDPLKRAQYLLSLRGIDVEDESAKLGANELLMEVMEAREAVEEVEDEAGLEVLRGENEERIAGSVGVLEEAFAGEEWEKAAEEAVRLRYWRNVGESIEGWEAGKGGGLLHH